LRPEQQTTAVVPIGNHAAGEREQQDRQLTEKIVEPEEERRLGEVEHQPALRDLLHPRPDRRRERAEPEDPEVAVREGGERSLEERLGGRRRRFCVWLGRAFGLRLERSSQESSILSTTSGNSSAGID